MDVNGIPPRPFMQNIIHPGMRLIKLADDGQEWKERVDRMVLLDCSDPILPNMS